MEFFTKFPVMDRTTLMEMRKGIDFAFRDFSRAYGDGIEAFFDPLLFFLVRLEKLLINSPWPIVIGVILRVCLVRLKKLETRAWSRNSFLPYRLLWYVERYHGNSSNYNCMRDHMHDCRNSCRSNDVSFR